MPNVVAQFLSVSVIAALAIAAAPASGATAQRTFVASTGLKATAIGNSSLLVSGGRAISNWSACAR